MWRISRHFSKIPASNNGPSIRSENSDNITLRDSIDTTIVVKSRKVKCDGGGVSGHPAVFLNLVLCSNLTILGSRQRGALHVLQPKIQIYTLVYESHVHVAAIDQKTV